MNDGGVVNDHIHSFGQALELLFVNAEQRFAEIWPTRKPTNKNEHQMQRQRQRGLLSSQAAKTRTISWKEGINKGNCDMERSQQKNTRENRNDAHAIIVLPNLVRLKVLLDSRQTRSLRFGTDRAQNGASRIRSLQISRQQERAVTFERG